MRAGSGQRALAKRGELRKRTEAKALLGGNSVLKVLLHVLALHDGDVGVHELEREERARGLLRGRRGRVCRLERHVLRFDLALLVLLTERHRGFAAEAEGRDERAEPLLTIIVEVHLGALHCEARVRNRRKVRRQRTKGLTISDREDLVEGARRDRGRQCDDAAGDLREVVARVADDLW